MSLRPSIEELRQLGHHASRYNWGIQFIELPAALSGFTSADLNTRAISFQAPQRDQDVATINLRGHKVYQHGIMNYSGTIALQIHETVDRKTGTFFEKWMDLQWEPITGVQIPKATNQAIFLLTLLDSEDKAQKYYTIFGAWPKSFEHGTYDASTSDVVTYNISFQYDYYISA